MKHLNPFDIAKAQELIHRRNQEMITLAAHRLFPDALEDWRDRVLPIDPAIQADVTVSMRALGYCVPDNALSQIPDYHAAHKIQDIYVIQLWQKENSRPSTSQAVVRRQKEFAALLDLNVWQLAKAYGIEHSNPQELKTRLLKTGGDIGQPTQARGGLH